MRRNLTLIGSLAITIFFTLVSIQPDINTLGTTLGAGGLLWALVDAIKAAQPDLPRRAIYYTAMGLAVAIPLVSYGIQLYFHPTPITIQSLGFVFGVSLAVARTVNEHFPHGGDPDPPPPVQPPPPAIGGQ